MYSPLTKVLHQVDTFKQFDDTQIFDPDAFARALEQTKFNWVRHREQCISYEDEPPLLRLQKNDNESKQMLKDECPEEL